MSTLQHIGRLSATALEVVVELFLSILTRPLRREHLRFELDTATSELVITALDSTASGEAGIYKGTTRWPYVKADLALVMPHPLAVEVSYPLTFRQLRAQMLSRYDFLLEENEFALKPNGAGLMDDSNIATPLINQYGQFHLYATEQSGRFKAGSKITLIFIQPGRRIPLRGLFDVETGDILKALTGQQAGGLAHVG